jgi:hypothetical protein
VANRAVFTEDFLTECRALGKVRLVHRNAVGIAEAFVDLSTLEIADGWANLVREDVHVHLSPKSLGAVAFRTIRSENSAAAPAIWLYGEAGCPLVLVVLDQTRGAEAAAQEKAYARLSGEYGPFFHLVSRARLPGAGSGAVMPERCETLQ